MILKLPHGAILPIAYIVEFFARTFRTGEPFITVDGIKLARKRMFFTHAKASNISLELQGSGSEVSLRVADNGRGFDVDAAPGLPDGHYGLLSIQERARGVNGRVQIRSVPGQGRHQHRELPRPGRRVSPRQNW